jgi:hypothetical protein
MLGLVVASRPACPSCTKLLTVRRVLANNSGPAMLCAKCGKPACQNKCGGCELVGYCSRICQKEHWREHKAFCKLVKHISPSSNALIINPTKAAYTKNVDLCLIYAQKYLSDLKHLDIGIGQEFLLPATHPMQHTVSGLVFSEPRLREIIQTRQFESIRLTFDDCCWDQVIQLTLSGRVYLPLRQMTTLQSFSLSFAVFDSVNTLCDCLSSQLKQLTLDYVYMERARAMNSSECYTLVRRLTDLRDLVSFSMHFCQMSDYDLEAFLIGRDTLRSLVLSSNFAPHQPGSFLTDRALLTIARSCPNLQAIDLSYQRRITYRGISNLMKGCIHLREARFGSFQFTESELKQLLTRPSADKLRIISLECIAGGDRQSYDRVITSTGGRIVLHTPREGIIQPIGLASDVMDHYENSKQLIRQLGASQQEMLGKANIWDAYF